MALADDATSVECSELEVMTRGSSVDPPEIQEDKDFQENNSDST